MILNFLFACADFSAPAEEPSVPAAVFAPLGDEEYRVAQIDPERYLGLWYEFAAIPAGVQARCTATTAEYTLLDQETIGVHNECHLDTTDGTLSQVDGTATSEDDRFSHLKVSFFSSFQADYYVVEADGRETSEPYDWAVVSTFDDAVIWVLSRTPDMNEDRYDLIMERLEERALPVDKIVETEHP
jgi:lipocalin